MSFEYISTGLSHPPIRSLGVYHQPSFGHNLHTQTHTATPPSHPIYPTPSSFLVHEHNVALVDKGHLGLRE